MSMKKMGDVSRLQNCSFYEKEILRDFQDRRTAIEKEKQSVPNDSPKSVGMPTINPRSNVGKYFVEFASSSTVHGLNHLVAPNRHPVERFLAVLIIFGALICLILLSFLFWDRYQNHATVIVVDNDREQFKILKPALFMCPVPNVDKNKLPAVLKKYDVDHTAEAEEFITTLSTVTYEDMKNIPIFDKIPSKNWLQMLHDLRIDLPSNVLKENDPYETWTVTEKGLCFATRSISAHYATLSYWMKDNWTIAPTPEKLPYYGHNVDGIEEYIAVEHACTISTCDPFEVATYHTPTRWAKTKTLQRAILSMSELKTEENVAELQIHQRKCKYLDDGGLKTWPIYSKNMCVIECRMKVIQKRCKCRPHFARPLNNVEICNATQLRCIGHIIDKLFLYEHVPKSCGCIPKCNVVSYQIRDIEKSELDETPISSAVMMLIVELPQVVYYRSLLYGFNDFLTGVGGAAGLFLGASVLSFVEILYYITLHVYFYAKQRNQVREKEK